MELSERMNKKMSFFDWFVQGSNSDIEKEPTDFIRTFVTQAAWSSYSSSTPVHDGDCTDMPYSCSLCTLEDLLKDYRKYFFKKEKTKV